MFDRHFAYAQDIPASVDSGRILRAETPSLNRSSPAPIINPTNDIDTTIPEDADNINFALKYLSIHGMSIFQQSDFAHYFEDIYGLETPASILWETANHITKAYRDQGYFLSKAYIPQQDINDGYAQIKVIEGYISSVVVEGITKRSPLIQSIIKDLKSKKPLRSKDLEEALLRLNDIHGMEFEAILGKADDGENGTAKLTLIRKKAPSKGAISTNNYGSRFVGPVRSHITYDHSFAQGHSTNINGIASMPNGSELWLVGVGHDVQITPSVELGFLLSASNSAPGFTLKDNDIDSQSTSWKIDLRWQPIRQRNQNMRISIGFDALNSQTDILGARLTEDKVRAARLSINYDFSDRFLGFNTVQFTLSQGINALNSSKSGDLNLSRSDAKPSFTKIEASYKYQKFLGSNLILFTQIQGQLASKSLYSSEEFGFGGAYLGRGYDFSEITGDHGIAASAELSYTGLETLLGYKINPFAFYDIGKTWNKGLSTVESISASSVGFGARAYSANGIGLDASVALPLTKSIDNPIYGNGKNIIVRFGLIYQLTPK